MQDGQQEVAQQEVAPQAEAKAEAVAAQAKEAVAKDNGAPKWTKTRSMEMSEQFLSEKVAQASTVLTALRKEKVFLDAALLTAKAGEIPVTMGKDADKKDIVKNFVSKDHLKDAIKQLNSQIEAQEEVIDQSISALSRRELKNTRRQGTPQERAAANAEIQENEAAARRQNADISKLLTAGLLVTGLALAVFVGHPGAIFAATILIAAAVGMAAQSIYQSVLAGRADDKAEAFHAKACKV